MIGPEPPDGDLSSDLPEFNWAIEDDRSRLQDSAEAEYGIFYPQAVLIFWLLNTLGVVIAGSLGGGVMAGLGGAILCGPLGGIMYAFCAYVFAELTEVTAGRLSRSMGVSAGIVSAALVLLVLRPVEPIEASRHYQPVLSAPVFQRSRIVSILLERITVRDGISHYVTSFLQGSLISQRLLL